MNEQLHFWANYRFNTENVWYNLTLLLPHGLHLSFIFNPL